MKQSMLFRRKREMKESLRLRISLLLLCLAVCGFAAGQAATTLPRSSPEDQGISSAAILAWVDTAEREIDALHGFILVRHGRVVAEGHWSPYNALSPHELFSLSKSFTSTSVGMAIAEGKLSVDDEVLKFFPQDAPDSPGENLRAMRIRDLLCMSTGQTEESPSAPDKISPKAFLAQSVPYKPGTHFKYNTPATFMLSAIVQKVTGMTVLDYLGPRLFAPLGIEHPTWQTNTQGISLGGYGLRVRTEDIARFGQLYLQKGKWQGKQLVPASWVEAATARQTSNGSNPKSDWDQGYGYQFWRCRHGAYRGDGAFGQFCIVMPEQDAVMAITSGVRDLQKVLNVFWDTVLPAMQTGQLPPNPEVHGQLQKRLAGLNLPTQQGSASSPLAPKVVGKKFAFPANDQKVEEVSIERGRDGGEMMLVVRMNGSEEHRLACGSGKWEKGRFPMGQSSNEAVAASGAWQEEDTYTAKLCFYETPTCLTIKLRFAGDQLSLASQSNVGFGPTKQPDLVGHAR
jgi:CubicO group peptidase (beta-lactamase class C family)